MTRPADLYLDLLSRCLAREIFGGEQFRAFNWHTPRLRRSLRWVLMAPALNRLERQGVVLARIPPRPEFAGGAAAPNLGETMVGLARLRNVRECIRTIIDEGVGGDLVEAGVWRSGTAVLMRGALAAYEDPDRHVWLGDSLGIPLGADAVGAGAGGTGGDEGDERTPGVDYAEFQDMAAGVDAARANFRRFNLLDDRVRFLDARFDGTPPGRPLEQAALIRVDADVHDSTMRSLRVLYPKLSHGGFLVIDDHHHVQGSRQAVEAFRAEHAIADPIHEIDGSGIYWRKA